MGNSHPSHRKEATKQVQVVTVLQGDGRVLEFSRPLSVADLLNEHPDHFVCHSNTLVIQQQGKMLPGNALLLPGNVYFLLPLRQNTWSRSSSSGTEDTSVSESGKPSGTLKFRITKQQLAKILAEGNMKVRKMEPELILPQSQTSSGFRPHPISVLHQESPMVMKRLATWSPRLESISEVPVM